jgi:hypothetical protein
LFFHFYQQTNFYLETIDRELNNTNANPAARNMRSAASNRPSKGRRGFAYGRKSSHHGELQAMQTQISWLLQQQLTMLSAHCSASNTPPPHVQSEARKAAPGLALSGRRGFNERVSDSDSGSEHLRELAEATGAQNAPNEDVDPQQNAERKVLIVMWTIFICVTAVYANPGVLFLFFSAMAMFPEYRACMREFLLWVFE